MKKCGFFVLLAALLLIISCSNERQNKEAVPAAAADSAVIEKDSVKPAVPVKAEMVISDIPFPFEILEKLHSSNISFDQKVMNALNNIPKYNQYNSKALNLGIYGADLAYVVTYEQFQLIGAYVKNAKKIADDLNIPFAFNQNMMDKYSKYRDNKDSLRRAVYDSYHEVDKSLREDERVGIAALVVTGSWLEGLYISTQTFLNSKKNKDNIDLYKTIGGQKQSLAIVVKFLDEYKNDKYIAGIRSDLKKITSLYDNVSLNAVMNDEQLLVINKEVENLRRRIVEGL